MSDFPVPAGVTAGHAGATAAKALLGTLFRRTQHHGELQRKGVQAGMGIGIGGAGAMVALLGLGALVAAAVLGLATVLAAWLAALIIGATLLALAGVVSAAGTSQVRKSAPPVPEQAVQSTKRDIETVKESRHS